ncbi:MAG: DUF1287 domain-containing protein [Flavobacteriaceae bacterium]
MKPFLLSVLFFFLSLIQVSGQTTFSEKLACAALELTEHDVTYDPAYFSIPYPNGDLPSDKGVCTDVIIRGYRALGIDLQKKVHEDMKSSFKKYPKNWGLKRTDRNIDHRRVPNLMTYFERHGTSIEVTLNPDTYLPGDVVCWRLEGGMYHIGFVVDKKSKDGKRPMIVHNIGAGQVLEDVLFSYTIIGHYRYGN